MFYEDFKLARHLSRINAGLAAKVELFVNEEVQI